MNSSKFYLQHVVHKVFVKKFKFVTYELLSIYKSINQVMINTKLSHSKFINFVLLKNW